MISLIQIIHGPFFAILACHLPALDGLDQLLTFAQSNSCKQSTVDYHGNIRNFLRKDSGAIIQTQGSWVQKKTVLCFPLPHISVAQIYNQDLHVPQM